jgi:predicted MPP superfamily phosphohydrolase
MISRDAAIAARATVALQLSGHFHGGLLIGFDRGRGHLPASFTRDREGEVITTASWRR